MGVTGHERPRKCLKCAPRVARDYFDFVGEGPIEFMDEKFDELSNRIRAAAQAHESFLVATSALQL
jgi:hypothetical protein